MRTLTAIETATDGSDNYLQCQERGHATEDSARLFVDGVDADYMDGRADGKQNCRANGLKQEEMRAGLWGRDDISFDQWPISTYARAGARGHGAPKLAANGLTC